MRIIVAGDSNRAATIKEKRLLTAALDSLWMGKAVYPDEVTVLDMASGELSKATQEYAQTWEFDYIPAAEASFSQEHLIEAQPDSIVFYPDKNDDSSTAEMTELCKGLGIPLTEVVDFTS